MLALQPRLFEKSGRFDSLVRSKAGARLSHLVQGKPHCLKTRVRASHRSTAAVSQSERTVVIPHSIPSHSPSPSLPTPTNPQRCFPNWQRRPSCGELCYYSHRSLRTHLRNTSVSARTTATPPERQESAQLGLLYELARQPRCVETVFLRDVWPLWPEGRQVDRRIAIT